uniref:Uncharacterized protein n=1 Tax=Timema cristinae TaxID=61476 RepID=A0A7R9D6R9_TIMCR|nr:unnamed protein product [Timema cristinae]
MTLARRVLGSIPGPGGHKSSQNPTVQFLGNGGAPVSPHCPCKAPVSPHCPCKAPVSPQLSCYGHPVLVPRSCGTANLARTPRGAAYSVTLLDLPSPQAISL